jgi:hypothetical protein
MIDYIKFTEEVKVQDWICSKTKINNIVTCSSAGNTTQSLSSRINSEAIALWNISVLRKWGNQGFLFHLLSEEQVWYQSQEIIFEKNEGCRRVENKKMKSWVSSQTRNTALLRSEWVSAESILNKWCGWHFISNVWESPLTGRVCQKLRSYNAVKKIYSSVISFHRSNEHMTFFFETFFHPPN